MVLFEGTFTTFFNKNSHKKSLKTVEIKVFVTIFAWWEDLDPYNQFRILNVQNIRIRIHNTAGMYYDFLLLLNHLIFLPDRKYNGL